MAPEILPGEGPQPQPSIGADPGSVPSRVQAALPEEVLSQVTGEATFYADKFEGRRTASGIPFRQNQMVAAHRAYPFGTVLRVTNLRNDRSVNVRVVDRGPFGGSERVRRTIIDLSRRAAQQLGYLDAGRTPVRVEVLEWGSGLPG
ncbi:MAG: septal ring lytic transglycosylase RlpA family protein [Gemmatimonadetes bacterium]|nr:septal ring lytic transglycosylase RlpA family protein [Gemmatimonadota bacterium]